MIPRERLDELAAGVDFHCRKLYEFANLMREVKESIDQLRISQEKNYIWELQKLTHEQHMVAKELQRRGLPEASKYEIEFQSLKDSLDFWPVAVDQAKICDSEELAAQRANNVLDMIVSEHVRGKRFLDFGCGEGHIVAEAQKRQATVALGYDIDIDQVKVAKELITNSMNVIKANGPYDIVLLLDVLDHVVDSDPIRILKSIKPLLANGARIYVRNHPWSSRHGGHIYTKLNKAFIHLAFDDVELVRLGGYTVEANAKVVRPLETYRSWFDSSHFIVRQEIVGKTAVEEFFFQQSCVKEKILRHWDGDEMAMRTNMEIDNIDYTLENSESHQQIF